MQRLQHVAGFLDNSTLSYSVMTNVIRSNPIIRHDAQISNDMLKKVNTLIKGKRL